MSAVYDRHEYIKDLTGAGADQDLAEAIALGAVRVQESALATKEDMADLKMDMARLEASTKEDMAKLENRLTNKMYAAMVVQAGLIIALIKLMP